MYHEFHNLIAEFDSQEWMRLAWGIVPMIGLFLVSVVGIVGVTTYSIIKSALTHFRQRQNDEMEATLKLEMIQRGMTADQIEQVIGARMPANTDAPAWHADHA
jgi:hypothetical protein